MLYNRELCLKKKRSKYILQISFLQMFVPAGTLIYVIHTTESCEVFTVFSEPRVLPQLLFCCCEKPMTKINLYQETVYFTYSFQSIIKGSRGRNRSRMLVCSSGLLSFCFEITAQRWSHPRWAGHSYITPAIKKILPTGKSDGGNLLIEVPSSQVTLFGVKLTKTTQQA